MRRLIRLGALHASGRERALAIAKHGRPPRLVDGDPVLDAVAEVLETDIRVIPKKLGRLLTQPAVVLELKRGRQIPVEKRNPWDDAAVEQCVDQLRVKADAVLINRAVARRQDARP